MLLTSWRSTPEPFSKQSSQKNSRGLFFRASNKTAASLRLHRQIKEERVFQCIFAYSALAASGWDVGVTSFQRVVENLLYAGEFARFFGRTLDVGRPWRRSDEHLEQLTYEKAVRKYRCGKRRGSRAHQHAGAYRRPRSRSPHPAAALLARPQTDTGLTVATSLRVIASMTYAATCRHLSSERRKSEILSHFLRTFPRYLR